MKTSTLGFFVRNGWLTKSGKWTLFAVGWILMLLPLWLAVRGMLNVYIAFFLFCLGLLLGLAFGYEGKAKQFGFDAPFTNDPLGWRKAKESYRADTSKSEVKKQDQGE